MNLTIRIQKTWLRFRLWEAEQHYRDQAFVLGHFKLSSAGITLCLRDTESEIMDLKKQIEDLA
jgi:hypothetical protein